jgi:predicted GNAT family N-acyltransferase
MEIRRVEADEGIADAMSVRRAVFIDEQGVPEDRELDGEDDEAAHFVAYDDGEPIGAARLRPHPGTRPEATAKVERVAVLADRRGEGIGEALMTALEDAAVADGYEAIVLHAQRPVVSFYRALGYETRGEEFEDAGIVHREMEKRLG